MSPRSESRRHRAGTAVVAALLAAATLTFAACTGDITGSEGPNPPVATPDEGDAGPATPGSDAGSAGADGVGTVDSGPVGPGDDAVAPGEDAARPSDDVTPPPADGPAGPPPPANSDPASTASSAQSTISCSSSASLYAVRGGNLRVYSRSRPAQDDGDWVAAAGKQIDTGWQYKHVLSGGAGLFYGIDGAGSVHWERNDSTTSGEWATHAGAAIGDGFAGYDKVASGGHGALYGVDGQGRLHWHLHTDPSGYASTFAGGSGDVVGTGWGDFKSVVGGGEGLLYAIQPTGELHWYRHRTPLAGGDGFAADSGQVIGDHWHQFLHVVSMGGGVLYAVNAAGELLWYRHRDPAGGSPSWDPRSGTVIGEGFGDVEALLGDVRTCQLGEGPVATHAASLKFGLHPEASDALRAIGWTADKITQTIGSAAASAGTHDQDSTEDGVAYSAATDISIRGLSEAEIKPLLENLGRLGFAAWYRKPGSDGWPASEAPHIHAVYVACEMKASLKAQVRDWLVGKNGLASHTTYNFYRWSDQAIANVRALHGAFSP